jgi:hypothetical protein
MLLSFFPSSGWLGAAGYVVTAMMTWLGLVVSSASERWLTL